VPGSGVTLDQYGNIPRRTLVQILSQLKVQTVGGYESRATDSKRSQRTRARQGRTYFALPKGRGRLPPGIYARTAGKELKVIILFVDGFRYQKRFNFFETADRVVKTRFPFHFRAELVKALRSAR
jgi:hypothetical protein